MGNFQDGPKGGPGQIEGLNSEYDLPIRRRIEICLLLVAIRNRLLLLLVAEISDIRSSHGLHTAQVLRSLPRTPC